MSCPKCDAPARLQEWSSGFPATSTTPAEPAGFECLDCGHVYGSDEDRRAAEADYRHEELQQRELEEGCY